MDRIPLKLSALSAALVLGGMTVVSCSTTGGARGAPVPSNYMARVGNVKMDTLKIGYDVYVSRCIECHTDRTPVPPVGRPWHSEALGLSLYHSLTDLERYSVQAYLKAADKAAFRINPSSLQ